MQPIDTDYLIIGAGTAGVAIAATGVVLFLLDGDEESPQVGVVPTEGGAAAFGIMRF